jgi:Tol biopolymer transport system component
MRFFIIGILRLCIIISLIMTGICVITLGVEMPPSPAIVYMAKKANTNSWDLYMLDVRTKVTLQLTRTSNVDERYPTWSSDGAQLAYHVSYDNRPFDIVIMPIKTPSEAYVPFVADSNMGEIAVAYDKAMPAWSSDDTLIGFHAKTSNGRYGLFMGRPDGSGLQMIINPPDSSDVLHWAWSPDATQIIFAEMTSTRSFIYRLTLPDTIQPASVNRVNRELLIEDGFFPAWSPDGTKIVYMRETESGAVTYTTLWLYDVISHVNKPLIPYPENPAFGNWGYSEYHPEWSLDGKHIIFASNRDNDDLATFDLYMVEVNGEGISSNLRRLTFSTADEQAPDWGIYYAGG